jgi:hypothetical protein
VKNREAWEKRVHDTASQIGESFFSVYLAGKGSNLHILDVGSLDLNGSLRRFAPSGANYIGIDLAPGPGVDLVLNDPYQFPFDDNKFDAIISTSSFEHDSMFWLTFLEIVRVAKQGAPIYINAPSNGSYHLYPRDCWRFYPDAALSLIDWAKRNGHSLSLAESFIALRQTDVWNDCVMVFLKSAARDAGAPKIADHFPGSQNIRLSYHQLEVQNFSESTEDMLLIKQHRLLTSPEPPKPDNLLEALRSRTARSAAYFHPFHADSVPFRIAAGMICSNHTDEKTGTGYISLANGKTNAASGGATEGYSIRLPDTIEAAASGHRVSVNVVARAAGSVQSRFALAYSTNEVGNSGWRWQDAGPEWSLFTMEYAVPVMKNGNGDFVGILADTEGRPGTEFCYLSVNMTEDTKGTG